MDIVIVQTGLNKGDLTLEAAEALKSAGRILMHTERCGAAEWLKENGIAYASLDSVYDAAEDFDEHISMALQEIMKDTGETLYYCVMDLSDETVKRIFETDARVRVIGQSANAELIARAKGAYLTFAASDMENARLSSFNDTIVTEIDSPSLASEVKLLLMDLYPDETPIYVKTASGIIRTELTELDRLDAYSHMTACLICGVKELTGLARYDFQHLMQLIKRLRDPVNGCPWDKEQTHESLKRDALEEAYELQDAIENGDEEGMEEEIGDVLFAAALQIQIAEEHGEFTATDVISGVIQKMISRHSHVFGTDAVSNMEGLFNLWDQAKRKEKGFSSVSDEMNAVAKALPALLRAEKVLKRAQKACPERLPEAADVGAKTAAEFGNHLLKEVQWAREHGIQAEKALEDAVNAYIRAFQE